MWEEIMCKQILFDRAQHVKTIITSQVTNIQPSCVSLESRCSAQQIFKCCNNIPHCLTYVKGFILRTDRLLFHVTESHICSSEAVHVLQGWFYFLLSFKIASWHKIPNWMSPTAPCKLPEWAWKRAGKSRRHQEDNREPGPNNEPVWAANKKSTRWKQQTPEKKLVVHGGVSKIQREWKWEWTKLKVEHQTRRWKSWTLGIKH